MPAEPWQYVGRTRKQPTALATLVVAALALLATHTQSRLTAEPLSLRPSSGYRAVLRNVCAAARNSGTIVAARVEATMPCMRTYPCRSGSTT
jgi:hypothetical protein